MSPVPGAGDAISDRARADAGDGDESLSWARGDAAASRHDGRTGGAVGGAGPSPAITRAALFEQFEQTRAALDACPDLLIALPPQPSQRDPAPRGSSGGGGDDREGAGEEARRRGRGGVVSVGVIEGGGGVSHSGYEAAKAAATGYAERREALLRGEAPRGSPLALWRA